MEWINQYITFPITDPTWIFLLVLVMILFAPILLDKLRIPHIIGMIIAGLLVGEHGFNILARDSSFELFGKVGLYYIMFLAGLEMNMNDFKENKYKALTRRRAVSVMNRFSLLLFHRMMLIIYCVSAVIPKEQEKELLMSFQRTRQ